MPSWRNPYVISSYQFDDVSIEITVLICFDQGFLTLPRLTTPEGSYRDLATNRDQHYEHCWGFRRNAGQPSGCWLQFLTIHNSATVMQLLNNWQHIVDIPIRISLGNQLAVVFEQCQLENTPFRSVQPAINLHFWWISQLAIIEFWKIISIKIN